MLSRFISLALLLSGLIACAPESNNSSAAALTPSSEPASPTSTSSVTPIVRPTGQPDSIRVKGETDYGEGVEPLAGKILSNLEIRSQDRLDRQSKLTLNGIGSLRLGMTVAEASLATGVSLNSLGQSAPGSSCSYVTPQGGPAGLNFMVIGNRIVRIDVVGNSPIATLSGAKIGDTEARIKALYPGRIEVTPHKYRPNGHYLTFVPKDPQDRYNRLIFETDGNRVTQFRVGKLPEVAWVEGCA